ncbi:MAG: hypothetical protein M0R70_10630 [Nitrospirae bacterium]|nr:hypothetical protein [Nitrospirota bacterium]
MSDTVFMVIPFSDEVAMSAYQHSTKPTVESFGFRIQRADEIFSANPVFDDIITAVEQSSIVIVDISGRNANCFYELGVAHTLKRNRTIMITHDEYSDIPFDVAHFRILKYENTIEGKAKYEENLKKTLQSITSGLPELYRGEFDAVIDIFEGLDEHAALCAIMAIPKVTRPIEPKNQIYIEGHFKAMFPIMSSSPGRIFLEPFRLRRYVEIVGDIYTLSAKGQAFSDYLASKGYVVDRLNDDIFTPGHVSWWERMKKKKK